jgi:hypothetical protein
MKHSKHFFAAFLFSFVAALLLAGGCCLLQCRDSLSQEEKKMIKESADLIKSGKTECVLITADNSVITGSGRGLMPLLKIYDENYSKMHNAIVVDKVVGKAAAVVAVSGKAKHIHALLISKDAIEFLQQRNVSFSYDLAVPHILNNSRTDLCPLEKSVFETDDIDEGIKAVKAKADELKKAARSGK